MNTSITLKMVLEAWLLWDIVIPMCVGLLGLIYVFHAMSGGYWPRWFYNLKKKFIKQSIKDDTISLNLRK
jgi:hypothetical protein